MSPCACNQWTSPDHYVIIKRPEKSVFFYDKRQEPPFTNQLENGTTANIVRQNLQSVSMGICTWHVYILLKKMGYMTRK